MRKGAGFLTGLVMSATAASAQGMPSGVLFFDTINEYDYRDGADKSLDKNDKTPFAADFFLSGAKLNELRRVFDTVTCADLLKNSRAVEVRFEGRYISSDESLTPAVQSSIREAVEQARRACAPAIF